MENEFDVNWKPLESNPEVMNPFAQNLGFDIEKYQFQDVLSLEEWAQEMIPKPVKALLLLFPIKQSTVEYEKDQAEQIKKNGQIVSSNLFFMKQYARNACGTVALVHSILNLVREDQSLIQPGSTVEKFYKDTLGLNAHDAGIYFLKCEDLKAKHSEAQEGGQSVNVEEVETHFISFVQKDGHLYELDGRKDFPINHGEVDESSFLAKACSVAQQFMDRAEGDPNFTILAFAPPQTD